MRSLVKVCGITNSADATAALAQGVEFLGVNCWPDSARFVPPEKRARLLAAIPPALRVCVDVAPSIEKLRQLAAEEFAFFQIHFDPSEPQAHTQVQAWSDCVSPARLWLAPRIGPGQNWPIALLPFANTFLCDGFHAGSFGGTGRTANWNQFSLLQSQHPGKQWILAGGLGPATLPQAMAASCARFFDLNSGVEDAPGRKNAEKLAQCLSILSNNPT